MSVCLCECISVCYVSFISNKRILLAFKNTKNGKKGKRDRKIQRVGRNGKIIASAAPIIT